MPSVMAARWVGQCCHLSNATDLLTPVLWTMASEWFRTPVLFLAVCGPKYTKLSLPVRECSLQRRFPIDDVLLVQEKFDVFGPPNFGGKGRATQISDRVL